MHGYKKKNHELVHVKHEKCGFFLPRGVNSRMRTINLDLTMQKGSRVVPMMIVIKYVNIIYIANNNLKVVALTAELSIQRRRI